MKSTFDLQFPSSSSSSSTDMGVVFFPKPNASKPLSTAIETAGSKRASKIVSGITSLFKRGSRENATTNSYPVSVSADIDSSSSLSSSTHAAPNVLLDPNHLLLSNPTFALTPSHSPLPSFTSTPPSLYRTFVSTDRRPVKTSSPHSGKINSIHQSSSLPDLSYQLVSRPHSTAIPSALHSARETKISSDNRGSVSVPPSTQSRVATISRRWSSDHNNNVSAYIHTQTTTTSGRSSSSIEYTGSTSSPCSIFSTTSLDPAYRSDSGETNNDVSNARIEAMIEFMEKREKISSKPETNSSGQDPLITTAQTPAVTSICSSSLSPSFSCSSSCSSSSSSSSLFSGPSSPQSPVEPKSCDVTQPRSNAPKRRRTIPTAELQTILETIALTDSASEFPSTESSRHNNSPSASPLTLSPSVTSALYTTADSSTVRATIECLSPEQIKSYLLHLLDGTSAATSSSTSCVPLVSALFPAIQKNSQCSRCHQTFDSRYSSFSSADDCIVEHNYNTAILEEIPTVEGFLIRLQCCEETIHVSEMAGGSKAREMINEKLEGQIILAKEAGVEVPKGFCYRGNHQLTKTT